MALGCRALLSQVSYNWRHNLRHDQEDALSTKSLMDAIGREKAQTLMDEAVFQAIDENRAYGLGSSKLVLGYARVSTDDQDLTNQRAELHGAGCIKIFGEKITGVRRDRPELARLLDHLRPGDVVTVTRLDRLARSTRDLLDIAERIQAAGAGLRSLAEPWADTTTPAGRMVLTVFAGIAEFERSLIIDRTRSGREAAKARGVKFGPRPTLSLAQIEHARELIDLKARTVKEVADLLGVHRSTLYRALEKKETTQ